MKNKPERDAALVMYLFRKKLKKGMEDTANGKVCSVEEAYEEVKEILAD